MSRGFKKLSSKDRSALVMKGAPIDPSGQYLGYQYNSVITLRGIHAYKEH